MRIFRFLFSVLLVCGSLVAASDLRQIGMVNVPALRDLASLLSAMACC